MMLLEAVLTGTQTAEASPEAAVARERRRTAAVMLLEAVLTGTQTAVAAAAAAAAIFTLHVSHVHDDVPRAPHASADGPASSPPDAV